MSKVNSMMSQQFRFLEAVSTEDCDLDGDFNSTYSDGAPNSTDNRRKRPMEDISCSYENNDLDVGSEKLPGEFSSVMTNEQRGVIRPFKSPKKI